MKYHLLSKAEFAPCFAAIGALLLLADCSPVRPLPAAAPQQTRNVTAPPNARFARSKSSARTPHRVASDANAIVARHNFYRSRHCAPPLTWSADLATTAQKWAQFLARDCKLKHSAFGYGENLWAGTAGAFSPEDAVDAWYRESAAYDFAHPGFSMETGHFTQLVWAATRRIGCAESLCEGMQIRVCNYNPPGNVEGEFAGNVSPVSCRR